MNTYEDKNEICRRLLPVLKSCYNTKDVVDLKYDSSREVVIASIYFCGSESSVEIAVSCESGSAMVIDIIRRLM